MNGLDIPSQAEVNEEKVRLRGQIGAIDDQIAELRELEDRARAAREVVSEGQRKLKNKIANKRTLLRMDRDLRSELFKALDDRPRGNPPEASIVRAHPRAGERWENWRAQVEQKRRALDDFSRNWTVKDRQNRDIGLYRGRNVPEPRLDCLEREIDAIREDWEDCYPSPTRKTRAVARQVCSKMSELAEQNSDNERLSNSLSRSQSIGVLEFADGSCAVAPSGRSGPTTVQKTKELKKAFPGNDMIFVEFDPGKYDQTRMPYLEPPHDYDDAPPKYRGGDPYEPRGRFCSERKLFQAARQLQKRQDERRSRAQPGARGEDKTVKGMYVMWCGDAAKNPCPRRNSDDPHEMAPCPSCKINHRRITRRVRGIE